MNLLPSIPQIDNHLGVFFFFDATIEVEDSSVWLTYYFKIVHFKLPRTEPSKNSEGYELVCVTICLDVNSHLNVTNFSSF